MDHTTPADAGRSGGGGDDCGGGGGNRCFLCPPVIVNVIIVLIAGVPAMYVPHHIVYPFLSPV